MWKLTGFLEKYQMAKNDMPTTLTDILRYDKEKGKRVKLKDCEILTQFLFNKNDFFLVKKGKFYAVYSLNRIRANYVCLYVKG